MPPPSAQSAPRATSATGPLDDQWITIAQLAETLNLAGSTIRTWSARGIGPRAHRFGRAVRFRRSEVEAWIEARSA